MCGIAGRFNPVGLNPDPDWHWRADKLLAHRGPDGHGHYRDHHCELVHRRLALIDLSETGHQPMTNEDGSIYIIFNGEIYNHAELKKDLLGRHVFRGTSDTEVLLHLYEDLGLEMIPRLRGMFTFALYDAQTKRVLLARDRFGIKPLYYTFLGDELVFASEIKAILSLSGFVPQIDRQACYDFLGLGYIPEPATGYSNIQMLPKGHLLFYTGHTRPTPRRYWQIQVRPDPSRNLNETMDGVREALNDAVEKYVVADVPVAALLSGGIDSSLVVSSYARTARQPLRTFNVRFPDKNYDETPLATAVAKHYSTHHTTLEVEESRITVDLAAQLLNHFDQPFADTSLIPMYLVSKAIRDSGIICTLSGDGGDEVFGGYDCFWRANKLMALAALPGFIQISISQMSRLGERFTQDLGRQARKAIELARIGKADMTALICGLSNYLSETQKEALVAPDARNELAPAHRLFENEQSGRREIDLEQLSIGMTENLFEVGLPADMLRKVDMMSMLAGIEIRVPLLDERLVDIGLSIPHHLKTDGRRGKLVLRALADRWLPKSVVNHPKHGFSIPLDVLLNDRFFQMLDDYLLSSGSRVRSILNAALLRQWLGMLRRSHLGERSGSMSREGLYQRVFMVLSLELWMRNHALAW